MVPGGQAVARTVLSLLSPERPSAAWDRSG